MRKEKVEIFVTFNAYITSFSYFSTMFNAGLGYNEQRTIYFCSVEKYKIVARFV